MRRMGQLWRLAALLGIAVGALAFVRHTRSGAALSPKVVVRGQAQRGLSTSSSASVDGYYILFRLAQQRAEAQERETLQHLLGTAGLSAQARARVAQQLAALAAASREETEVEGLLASQGIGESAVVISHGQAMVVVPAKGMSPNWAARIGTDLWHLAGIPPQDVLIRPRP
jgi:hypothetical protein